MCKSDRIKFSFTSSLLIRNLEILENYMNLIKNTNIYSNLNVV